MLNIHKETAEGDAVVLKLEGDATIESAEQLYQALIDGLKNHKHLMVDCTQTHSIDFYAIQLLCSAHRSAVAWGKSFSFLGSLADPVKATIQLTGFLRDHGCALCPEGVSCMWTGHNCSPEN